MNEQIKVTDAKKWYTSKTLWINVLMVAGLLITGFNELLTSGQAITLVAVVNLILRTITKSKLEWV